MTYMHFDKDYSTNENIENYFNYFFEKSTSMYFCFEINKLYQREINFFGPYQWDFFDSLIIKLKTYRRLKFVDTLMLMYTKSNEEKGLGVNQKSKLAKTLLNLFLYYSNKNLSSELINLSKHMSKFIEKDIELMKKVISDLSTEELEDYVLNVFKLKNERLILNSFFLHLNSQTNFSKFKSFIRHVNLHHSKKVEEQLLISICSTKYPPFDWIFSTKKFVKKPVLNKLIIKYLNDYPGKYANAQYLKSLLKFDFNELYKNTIVEMQQFLSLIEKPTKLQKDKIKKLKQRFK